MGDRVLSEGYDMSDQIIDESQLKKRIDQLETENSKLKTELSWRTIRCMQLQTVLSAKLSLMAHNFGKTVSQKGEINEWFDLNQKDK
jgi:L-fucose isomerase-like protein